MPPPIPPAEAPAPPILPTPATPAPTPDPAPPPPLPAGADSIVTDVNSSLWSYIKKRRMPLFIASISATVLWEGLAIALIGWAPSGTTTTSSGQSGQGEGFLIVLPFALFFGWIAYLKGQFEDAMLEEFAASNGYEFEKTGTVDEAYGDVFRIAGRQGVTDIVTGRYHNCEMRLFLYQVIVGSGRYSTTYRFTVMELDLHGQMPHLLLSNKSSKLRLTDKAGSAATAFSGEEAASVSLEGDFNKYFTLDVTKGQETQALEVFTPDVMQLMEEDSKHYDVEVVENLIYVYFGKYVGTGQQLSEMFALAEKLIAKLAPVAERMGQDTDVTAHQVAPTAPRPFVDLNSAAFPGLSLKKIGKAALIWLLAMAGVGLLLLVAFLIASAPK